MFNIELSLYRFSCLTLATALAFFCAIGCPRTDSAVKEGLGNELSQWVANLYNNSDDLGFVITASPILPEKKDGVLGEADLLRALNNQAKELAHSQAAIDSVLQIRQYYGQDETIHRYHYNPFYSKLETYEDFWHAAKPVVGKIFEAALDELGLPQKPLQAWPVLHFRCSDGPFNKHDDYAFPKYSYYLQVVEHMKQNLATHYPDWYLITGCGWGIPESKKQLWCGACDKYIEDLQFFLKEKAGIELTVLNNHPLLEDWANMFKAPVLISSIPSSLSFMAGSVSPGAFYSPAYSSQAHGAIKIYTPRNSHPHDIYFVHQSYNNIIKHNNTNWINYSEVIEKLKS